MADVKEVRVLEGNFIPLPQEILDELGLAEGDTVHFFKEDGDAWSIVPDSKLREFKMSRAEDIMRRYHETLEKL